MSEGRVDLINKLPPPSHHYVYDCSNCSGSRFSVKSCALTMLFVKDHDKVLSNCQHGQLLCAHNFA